MGEKWFIYDKQNYKAKQGMYNNDLDGNRYGDRNTIEFYEIKYHEMKKIHQGYK